MAKNQPKNEKRSDRIIGRRYRYTGDYKVLPAMGGSRERRVVYVGKWILPANEPEEYRKIVLWMRLLLGVAVLAFAGAIQVLPAPMTNKWYVPVLMIAVFPLAYGVLGAFALPAARRRMERQQYDKSFVRVGHSAVFALAVMGLGALGTGIFWIVNAAGGLEPRLAYTLRDGLYLLLLALSAGAELAVWKLFRRVRPETLEEGDEGT